MYSPNVGIISDDHGGISSSESRFVQERGTHKISNTGGKNFGNYYDSKHKEFMNWMITIIRFTYYNYTNVAKSPKSLEPITKLTEELKGIIMFHIWIT